MVNFWVLTPCRIRVDIDTLGEHAASIFTLTEFGSDRHWSEWKKEIFERPQGMWPIRIIDTGEETSRESAEIERICDTSVLEEHAVATFRVSVKISAALVQDLSPLFFPLFWKATFIAAFPYNWPSHFSVYLNLIQSPRTGRQHFLWNGCTNTTYDPTQCHNQMTITCAKCAIKASKLMCNNVANERCRSLQNQLCP